MVDSNSSKTSHDLDYVSQAVSATVTISDFGSGLLIGSGFIVHPDGLVVTARHVVDMENGGIKIRRVRVHLSDDTPVEAAVFCSNPDLDYALIWVRKKGVFPAIPIGAPKRLRFGETVFMVGSPQGFKNTVSKGIVANPRRVYKGASYIQTDAAMYHGNSGGPLFNRKGVVGIVSWGRRGGSGTVIDNLNFAVPIDYLTGDIELAVARGKKPCLGASYCVKCGRLDFDSHPRVCAACGHRFAGLGGRRKPQEIDEILAACDSHARAAYGHILEEWKTRGHVLQAGIGGISLKAKMKGRPVGLASLRANVANGPAIIVLGWEGLRQESVLPKEAIDRFQSDAAAITELRVQPTTAHVTVNRDFTLKKADDLARALTALISCAGK